jgi:hypothetical protein
MSAQLQGSSSSVRATPHVEYHKNIETIDW